MHDDLTDAVAGITNKVYKSKDSDIAAPLISDSSDLFGKVVTGNHSTPNSSMTSDWLRQVYKKDMVIADDQEVYIGDDFAISGKDLKTCLQILLKQAKEDMPEEFI